MNKIIRQIPKADQKKTLQLLETSEIGVLVHFCLSNNRSTTHLSGNRFFVPLQESKDFDPQDVQSIVKLMKDSKTLSKEQLGSIFKTEDYYLLDYQVVERKRYSLESDNIELQKRIFRDTNPQYYSLISDKHIVLPGGRYANRKEYEDLCSGEYTLPRGVKNYKGAWVYENFGYIDLDNRPDHIQNVVLDFSVKEYNTLFGCLLLYKLKLPFKKEERISFLGSPRSIDWL